MIAGKASYLASPFVTSGDRLYLVGHQDGSFAEIGWHVPGEMGGIWDHPIKLMDGFGMALLKEGDTTCLNAATEFRNYPFGNAHEFRNLPIADLWVERFQFVPDSEEAVVIEYLFHNESSETLAVEALLTGQTDLRPVWIGERTGMIDGPDRVWLEGESGITVGKDLGQDWYVMWRSNVPITAHDSLPTPCYQLQRGQGRTSTTTHSLVIPAGASIAFRLVIAGSYESEVAARATLEAVERNAEQMLTDKQKRMSDLAQTARLEVPDSTIQQAFEWVKYSTDWLIRDVPEIGRGLSAGSPDYPWWFGCDNTYSLRGVLATGRIDIAYATLNLLTSLSERTNGNGRIIHEASTNGAVFNPGNINETPHFASMIWVMYQWTGDRAFLETYFPLVKKGLHWLLEENDADGNLLPDGFGMMEIHGMDGEMIDVAAYSCDGFYAAAQMAEELGDDSAKTYFTHVARAIHDQIRSDYWVEDFSSFADFIGTPAQALRLIDDAIVRADTLGKPWAVKELKDTRTRVLRMPPGEKRGFVLHHNWVVNTPMELGLADTAQALRALQTARQFVNPYGMFVTGIDRDQASASDEGSFAQGKKVFTYTGAVMTLPTGVQAIAENNYGRPDTALDYLRRMVRSFSYAFPGSMYEVSPDFGMMAQEWNVYALAYPIVTQFLGIQPAVARRQIVLQPQLPNAWPRAALYDLPLGDNLLSVAFQQDSLGMEIDLSQAQGDWEILLQMPAGQYRQWTVEGNYVTPTRRGVIDQVSLRGKKILVRLSR